MKAGQSTIDWLRSYYGALDELRFEEVGKFLHEDCVSRYPTGHVVEGRELVLKLTERALTALARIQHELRSAWEEGEEVIYELEVTYRRRDGQTIVRPGVGIFVLEDGLIREQRLFVDARGVWD